MDQGASGAVAELRALEIASVSTQYLGTLGYSATVHSSAVEDIDKPLLGWRAGILLMGKGGLGHPFAPLGLEISVVTTDVEWPIDCPLFPSS